MYNIMLGIEELRQGLQRQLQQKEIYFSSSDCEIYFNILFPLFKVDS